MSRSPNRLLGAGFGALFVLVGVLGSVPAFVTTDGLLFGALQVNLPQNALRVLLGAGLLVAALAGVRPSRITNSVAGTTLLVLGLVGLFLVGSEYNVLALNVADNVMHFGSAAVLLAVGLGADKATTDTAPQ